MRKTFFSIFRLYCISILVPRRLAYVCGITVYYNSNALYMQITTIPSDMWNRNRREKKSATLILYVCASILFISAR